MQESWLFKIKWGESTVKPNSLQKTISSFPWKSFLGPRSSRGVQVAFMSSSTTIACLYRVYFSNDPAFGSACLEAVTTHGLIWCSTCPAGNGAAAHPPYLCWAASWEDWANTGWGQELWGCDSGPELVVLRMWMRWNSQGGCAGTGKMRKRW